MLVKILRKERKKDIIINNKGELSVIPAKKGEYIIMKETKMRNRRRRLRRGMRGHRQSVFAIIAVLVLLVAVVSVNSMTLRAKEKSYQAQEIELAEQIEKEKARSKEIDELEKYVGTEEYVEEVAREKLGLVHENEIIFKAE